MAAQQSKTIGERLIDAFLFISEPDRSYRALAAAIDAAIEAERERCAVIADKQAGKGRTMGDTKAIASAIRNPST